MRISTDNLPKFIGFGNYHVDVPWSSIDRTLDSFTEMGGVDLDPDFQREHVWTLAQQKAYVEFVLQGGRTGRDILFNHAGWSNHTDAVMELVDGKQRMAAVMAFLRDEFTVFDTTPGVGPVLASEIDGLHGNIRYTFRFYVNDLRTRAEVLRWYLQLNAGGVVHTQEELDKVRQMLAAERA